jgi:hypothetical protein
MKSHATPTHFDPDTDELAARRPSTLIEAKIRSEIRRDLEMMVQYAAKLGLRKDG